ncbi:2-dehydro-3-deoxygalactonokinase [Lelliottia wanjuensis]|uniref:2-dehydro-3-deoxygalactonokinase n=1 Tax=Lelliottia wanjuensis TaxID=3050585 RepID=A0AAP4D0I4_9ENTR|nr:MULTISPECIES: 2-dehydro-3-deoxygalactonokinase [unclassified Lelliottia]MDK9361920.1 2-dehydro-3-deoxygalactonokinase [Lelliottia sp. V106_12]MDK9617320.1 2-dehydro-3-deoxygalactonokinase [Lelliottia sp. V106_9]
MSVVTVDCGTTNTRVRVWRNNVVVAQASEPVGVRDTARVGNHAILAAGIRHALMQAMAQAENALPDDYIIVASGMVTSDAGLCPLPHLRAPVSLADLAQATVARYIPDIALHPVWFIPGVRNTLADISTDNIGMMDVMRGEEVETFGLLALHAISGPAVIILPGSHTKFVRIDSEQRITACATSMTGELLDLLTRQSLLAASLESRFSHSPDTDYLLKGAQSCRESGLTRACFSVRLLDLFTRATHDQKAGWLLGAALSTDIQTLKTSPALAMTPDTRLIICGKPPLAQALTTLINADPFFTAVPLLIEEYEQTPLSGVGAIAVLNHISALKDRLHHATGDVL